MASDSANSTGLPPLPPPPPPHAAPSISSTVSSARSSMLDRDSILSEATVSTVSTFSTVSLEELDIEASDVLPDPSYYSHEAPSSRHPLPKRITPRTSGSQRLANATSSSRSSKGLAPQQRPLPLSMSVNASHTGPGNDPVNAEPPKRSYSGATPQIALEMARQQVARSLTHGPSPRSPLSPRRVPLPGQAPQRNKSLSLSATIGSHLAGKPRKSQKELEKLCDDDGDDLVLEDDMALFNVPMSPSLTSVGSSFAEVTRAPRPDPQPTRLSTHIPHIIPRGPHRSPNRRMPPSRSPSGNRLPSMPEGPREPDDPKPRTQSWTKAHADLSNEARQLAEALAAHEQEAKGSLRSASTPDLSRLAQEAVIPVRRESHGRRASWFKRRSTSSVELIQGVPVPETAVIDETLPDSDEKKALMSRTRPGWLPPKNKKEEEKHLREYQRMMAQSIEADRVKMSKLQSLRRSRDEDMQSLAAMWTDIVLPEWDHMIHDKRARQLRWKGIPPGLRPHIWSKIVGNELGLSVSSYQDALKRAQDEERETSSAKVRIWGARPAPVKKKPPFGEIDQALEDIFSLKRRQTVSPQIGFDADQWRPDHRVRQVRRILIAHAVHRSYRGDAAFLTPLAATLLYAMSPSTKSRADVEAMAEATSFIRLANLTDTLKPPILTPPPLVPPQSPPPSRGSFVRVSSAKCSASPNSSVVSLPLRSVSTSSLPTASSAASPPTATPSVPAPLGPPLDLIRAFLHNDEVVKTTYYNAILGVLKIKAPKLHAHLILLTTGFGGEVAGWLELLVGTLCTAAFVGPTSTWVPPTPRRRTAEARGRSPVAEPSPALTGEPVPDLQMEKLVRLWDVLLFEGENAVIRGAVARLMECEEAIAKCERGWEVRDALLGRGLEVVDEEEEEEEERREAEAERRASSRVRSATIVREKDVEDWMELVKEAGKV